MSSPDAAFAFLLGVVAAFNPCGFALLPAYLAVIVTGSANASVTRLHAIRHAISFGLAMTLGFVTVFTGFGLLFGGVNAALQGSVLPLLPYVTVALGVVLVALGATMLVRGELRGPGLRVAGRAPQATFASQVLYGATFALASLSCTIGPFLAVVTTALTASNPFGAVGPFVIYAAGMGSSILFVSVAAALAGVGIAAVLRAHTGLIMRIGGGVMIVAGIYVLAYGLAEILPRFGIHALDPLLLRTAGWQGAITTAIQEWGTPVLVALGAVVATVVIAVLVVAARVETRPVTTPPATPPSL